MKELHELIKYLKDNGYAHLKVNPDLLVGIIEYFANKQETKQCNITDVSHLLIAWEQYKKANWWESESVDVEKYLMEQFKAIYCG